MKTLTAQEVRTLFAGVSERGYEQGQIMVYHGDTPNHVMFIKSGAVKIYDTDSDGNERLLDICGKGSFFPLLYAFGNQKYVEMFYTSLCPTKVLMIPLENFQARLADHPGTAYRLLKWFGGEMNFVLKRLKSLEKSSANEKLLEALGYLLSRHSSPSPGNSTWHRVNFPISQQTLADMTGLTRETVNTILKNGKGAPVTRTSRKSELQINMLNLEKALENI